MLLQEINSSKTSLCGSLPSIFTATTSIMHYLYQSEPQQKTEYAKNPQECSLENQLAIRRRVQRVWNFEKHTPNLRTFRSSRGRIGLLTTLDG